MLIRLSPLIVLPAVLIAGVVGYIAADRPAPAPTTITPATAAPISAGAASGQLPPGHPAIPGTSSPHSPHGGGAGAAPEPPSLDWTAPAAWQTQPNPSPMRLATYKVGDGAEMSVSRAGGGVDANVQRWVTQFEGSPKVDRTDKQVHGLKVTVVRIGGTFLGTGMGAAPSDKHEGWAMLAAIVDSTGSEYFFKVIGPADQVDGARAAFDGLVDSMAPHAAR